MSPSWSTLFAVFALFCGNTCHAACSWGKLEGQNYIKIGATQNIISIYDVSNLGVVTFNECSPESQVGDFIRVDYETLPHDIVYIFISMTKLKELTPSGHPPHIICFFLKASNCGEQWFEIEVNDTNTYDPVLLDENGDTVSALTHEVSMPLLKGVKIGVELLVKDIDLSNLFVNVTIPGDELYAEYVGEVGSLRKLHRYSLVPKVDLMFSERTFDVFIEDEGTPRRISKAQLTLKALGGQVQEPIFERYYYKGTYGNGSLDLPSINYTNADVKSIQLLSDQGYQKYFTLEVTPDSIYFQAEEGVEYIKDDRIILVLVARQPDSLLVQHTEIFIEFFKEGMKETNRNCTSLVHIDNIENVNVSLWNRILSAFNY